MASASLLLLAGCSSPSTDHIAAQPSARCAAAGDLTFVCGTGAVEEVVALPGSDWLIGGRLAVGAKTGFVGVDRSTRAVVDLRVDLDGPSEVSDCPTPPDRSAWSFDGIALARTGEAMRIYAANHGGREAIEVFAVAQDGDAPALRWTGCLPMPAHTLANALAADGRGGLYVTSFHDPGDADAWQRMARGEATGSLWHWSRTAGFERVGIGPLSGANGVAVAADGTVYVSAWAASRIVAYDPASGAGREIATDFLPDNLHFDAAGRLLVGGQRASVAAIAKCGAQCPQPWVVARLDPASGEATQLASGPGSVAVNYACGAQAIDGDIWMTLRGDDRIAVFADRRES